MSAEAEFDTHLIVGLGNPGPAHRANRHNVGFMVLDSLATEMGQAFSRLEHQSLIAAGELATRSVLLAKPQTFMNVCGRAVQRLLAAHEVPLSNLLVISDDIDLPLGQLRLRPFGGTGGHKGLKSIQERLETQDYARLRIGIGRPPGRTDPADYVLDDFSEQERMEFEIDIRRGADCVRLYLCEGIQAAMTKYNQVPE
jgi:PTH1 family peptidyl-tRNA hydrolase